MNIKSALLNIIAAGTALTMGCSAPRQTVPQKTRAEFKAADYNALAKTFVETFQKSDKSIEFEPPKGKNKFIITKGELLDPNDKNGSTRFIYNFADSTTRILLTETSSFLGVTSTHNEMLGKVYHLDGPAKEIALAGQEFTRQNKILTHKPN